MNQASVVTPHRVAVRVGGIAAAVAAVAISAQVAVPMPFTPVPATLQPVAVLSVGALLGPRLGAAALVAYLAAGLAGLPVFAMGGSGLSRLLGPTGGYLMAFPVAAFVAGLGGTSRVLKMIPAMLGAVVVLHTMGAAQLALITGDGSVAWEAGVLPFLVGDLLKVGMAAALCLLLAPRLQSRR